MEKPDPYRPSLPHGVTINGFQVLLSNITYLPAYPIGRRYLCPTVPPPSCLIQSANDPQDPDPTPCTLGIKVDEGPLFNVGSPLSWPAVLTASPTLVLYFPLILSHVWKFFSNPHPDHDRFGNHKHIQVPSWISK